MFENYLQDHVVSWFNWAQKNNLGVERMEELIFVTGCTLVTSWAAAVSVYNNQEAEISLTSRMFSNVGTDFVWSHIRGPVVYHNSHFDAVCFQGYVYSAYTDFLLYYMESKTHLRPECRIHPRQGSKILRLGINASSSGAFVQSAYSSGPNQFELKQNPVLTTLITAETVRYKRHGFQVLRK